MKRPSLPVTLAAGICYVFLYAPLAAVIVLSFNATRHGLAWGGFSWKWYEALWHNEVALQAARNTLALGLISTTLSTLLGIALGYALARYPLPKRRLLDLALHIPIFLPDIVLAVAMLLFYSLCRQWLGLFQLGLTTMILGHVTFQIPFVALVIRARLAHLDPTLEEAAHDLGATPWQTFRHVTLPSLAPGIIAAAMLAFTLSLDDFAVSFFTSGPGSTTLPILIYSSVKRSISPDINALSTLILATSTLATLAVVALQRRTHLHR